MDVQNSLATTNVGLIQHHAAIKAARAQQSGIKYIGAVRGRDDDNIGVLIKTIHLDKQLVQGLLTLVVATHTRVVALAANGIYLVNKHNAWCMLFGLFEEITHACRANTHKHFYE